MLWLSGRRLQVIDLQSPTQNFWDSRTFKHFFSNLFILAAIVDCTYVYHVVHYTKLHMPYLVAFVGCTLVGSAISSFKYLVTIARENSEAKQQASAQAIGSATID